jgi:hypothetical protein
MTTQTAKGRATNKRKREETWTSNEVTLQQSSRLEGQHPARTCVCISKYSAFQGKPCYMRRTRHASEPYDTRVSSDQPHSVLMGTGTRRSTFIQGDPFVRYESARYSGSFLGDERLPHRVVFNIPEVCAVYEVEVLYHPFRMLAS